ncbi:glycosyltransferase family 4 protein [Pseudomonas sp. N040]|nr:glycosyltransferase family 4 protein [Pseudomonas sp. N040]MBW7012641.1 glycosyltransferase family 4 protein [Pseudomonas sp. N040]
MRLLIECTYVYEHPEVNSGIQRVVRNIVNQLDRIDSPVECIPVMMRAGSLYRVNSLAPLKVGHNATLLHYLIVTLDHLRNRYFFWHSRLERLWPFGRSRFLRRVLYVLAKLGSLSITLPLRAVLWLNRSGKPAPDRAVPMEARAGDQLVLLDSSWHADFFPIAEKLRSQGVGLVSVIYDLIPLTHPQFCDAGLVVVFDKWFDWIARTADGFMAISKTISDQVAAEIERRLGPEEAARRWHGHFHLGSELDRVRPGGLASAALRELFRSGASTYLMVGTIEPRKNHAYLLDTFELLWAQDSSVRLCIIGRIGWKCEELIARIRRHPELNRRLFMINDANDTSLEYAYAQARALVFPSYVEGFGLPLVEAMQRGLPAFASDIPVFREIGGDFISYFDLADPANLAGQIAGFESSGQFPAPRSLAHWQWIGWREAAVQLVEGTLRGLHQADAPTAPVDAHSI